MSGDQQPVKRVSLNNINAQVDDIVEIPVVRSRDYVRLMPNSFSSYCLPRGPIGPQGPEPVFHIFFHVTEQREVKQYANAKELSTPVMTKDMVLEIIEIASATLTLHQMLLLKESVDSALRIWEESQAVGGAS